MNRRGVSAWYTTYRCMNHGSISVGVGKHCQKQECIKVGCVTSASVAVWEGGRCLTRGVSA